MAEYIITFTVLAGIVYLLFGKAPAVIYLRRLAIPAACIVFVLCLLLFSKTAVSAAARGLRLWFDIVFPSLFPFFVASEILKSSGFSKTAGILLEPVMRPLFNVSGSGSLALLMGVAGGYPAGAKITCDLLKAENISKTEAERLLAFTNNSGPLFITGAVATGMYGSPDLGFFLLACHILACLTVGILFRFYRPGGNTGNGRRKGGTFTRFRQELKKPSGMGKTEATAIFGDAVKNSISLILAIGGFIIFFSVIISLLLETGAIGSLSSFLAVFLSPLGISRDTLTAVLSGFFEITTGSSLASGLQGIPPEQQLSAASFIIGWAGLSVHSQVLSITAGANVSIKPYLTGKLLQAVIAAIYTWCGIKLLGLNFALSKPAMLQFSDPVTGWLEAASLSLARLAAILLVFAGLALLSGRYISLKKKNSGL